MFRYGCGMGKLGGLTLAALVAVVGCSASAAPVQPVTGVQSDMLAELRPLLTTLKASDSELISEAYVACANLAFRDKDSYRAAVLSKYDDMALGLDHLTVAAAAKLYLCP
jgi:hypothetical protein